MSLNSATLFVMLIAVALSPFFLIFQITRLAHSAFRNKLWVIRDSLVDDLRLGRVQRSQGAERLLDLVQMHIDIAGRHTFSDTLLGLAIYRSPGSVNVHNDVLGDSAPAGDRQRLTGYLNELRRASLTHLTWASPSGWIALPLLRFVGHARNVRLRRRVELSQRQIRENLRAKALRDEAERVELQVMPKLIPRNSGRLDVDKSAVLLTEVPC